MQIKELKIYSPKINAQAEFYAKILGLEIIRKSNNHVSLKIGASVLNIEYRPTSTPYHFAINIPAQKDLEALEWLKSRVEILKDGVHEIQDFDFWNAKAIYFYDEDKNIVELISRNNLKNKTAQKFDEKLFLNISEIGVPVENIEPEYNIIHGLTNMDIFSGGIERFLAVGDENGLFIFINKNEKDWFPTNEKAFSSEFEIKLMEKGIEYDVEFKNGKIKELAGVL